MSDDAIDPRFVELARTGDKRLRNELVEANQGLARAFAGRYRDRGVPAEDLNQVALVGLVRAVDRFDPERGIRFSTFAARTIEGDLKQHFRDKTWDLHVPRRLRQLATAVQNASGTLTQRLGRSPTPAEVATELGLDVADVTMAIEASTAYRSESLDLPDRAEVAAVTEMDRIEARLAAPALLGNLSELERTIVELRFYGGLSQSDIAERMGVSQMQISRLLRKALEQLRGELES